MSDANLDKELGRIVYYKQLAASEPDTLLRLLRTREGSPSALPKDELTFAAEAAGAIGTPAARDALLMLLRHPEAVVREGAIYGLASFLDPVVDSEIERMRCRDPNAGVRAAAEDWCDKAQRV